MEKDWRRTKATGQEQLSWYRSFVVQWYPLPPKQFSSVLSIQETWIKHAACPLPSSNYNRAHYRAPTRPRSDSLARLKHQCLTKKKKNKQAAQTKANLTRSTPNHPPKQISPSSLQKQPMPHPKHTGQQINARHVGGSPPVP